MRVISDPSLPRILHPVHSCSRHKQPPPSFLDSPTIDCRTNYRGIHFHIICCLGIHQICGVMVRQDRYIHPRLWKGSCPFYMYVFFCVHESISRELYLGRHVWSTGNSVRLSGSSEDEEIDTRLVWVRLQFTPENGRVSSVRWLGGKIPLF